VKTKKIIYKNKLLNFAFSIYDLLIGTECGMRLNSSSASYNLLGAGPMASNKSVPI
jgi:hypothetical protein